MKIKTTRIDLGKDLDYDGYYVVMPRSVKEGWIAEIQSEPGEADVRASNLRLLDLVEEWNLDDENGQALPLTKTLADHEERLRVLAEIPVDVLAYLATSLSSGLQERTKDFSNRS